MNTKRGGTDGVLMNVAFDGRRGVWVERVGMVMGVPRSSWDQWGYVRVQVLRYSRIF